MLRDKMLKILLQHNRTQIAHWLERQALGWAIIRQR
jgi:hypothetical protein